jgi:hypothetical protein
MLQRFSEKNRDILININGRLRPRDEAGISPFDSSVQGGDGSVGPVTKRLSALFAELTAREGTPVT